MAIVRSGPRRPANPPVGDSTETDSSDHFRRGLGQFLLPDDEVRVFDKPEPARRGVRAGSTRPDGRLAGVAERAVANQGKWLRVARVAKLGHGRDALRRLGLLTAYREAREDRPENWDDLSAAEQDDIRSYWVDVCFPTDEQRAEHDAANAERRAAAQRRRPLSDGV